MVRWDREHADGEPVAETLARADAGVAIVPA